MTTPRSRPLRLLAANRTFRWFWLARSTSYLGDTMGLVALLLYVQGTTGEALAVALLMLAGDFVPGLLGPFTGIVGDRFDRRTVLIACELIQAALVVVMAVSLPPLPVLVTLVALRSIVGQVFQPASRGAVAQLVPDADLPTANAALGAGTYGFEALGPVVAAVLLPVLDIRGILLVDAATFLVSAALLALLPQLVAPPSSPRVGFLEDARAGLAYIWRVPVLRVIGLVFVTTVVFNGVDDIALVFLATDSLRAGPSAAALLYAGVGIGLIIGYPLLARYGAAIPTLALVFGGFALGSAGNLLTGLAWSVAAALAMQTVRGLGISAVGVGVDTHLQRVVPTELQGRVFGNLYGAVGVAAGLSYVLGGALLSVTSARVTFVVAGGGALIVTALGLLALRRPSTSM